nr:N-6 DNA methylase [Geotalea toluenoxydans]
MGPQHCFRAVKQGGRMAMIAPEGVLVNTNQNYESIRKYLIDNSNLQSVISLPRGAFEPYNRAKADILFFTDCHYTSQVKHFWYFNVQNDGYTLDKRRERIEGGNDLEIVLSERDLEKQKEKYLLSIGVSRIGISSIKSNKYILSAGHYIESSSQNTPDSSFLRLNDLFEPSGSIRVGDEQDTPVMSITMVDGLIDQAEKFKKRIASKDISNYRKVALNDLVVGFPIDEGVLGFQTKYDFAAVSPAYKIWKLKRSDIDVRVLEMILRSDYMREVYRSKMQGAVDRRRSIPDDVFLEIQIPLPPKNVMKKIIEHHENLVKAKQLLVDKKNALKNTVESLWSTE